MDQFLAFLINVGPLNAHNVEWDFFCDFSNTVLKVFFAFENLTIISYGLEI